MTTRRIGSTAVRYWLLQIPGTIALIGVAWLVREPLGLPGWTLVAAVILWIAKDAALYPFVRHAYDNTPSRLVGPEGLVGLWGVAEERLAPTGYVRIRDERWRAELVERGADPVGPGEAVRVHALRGLTLLVRGTHTSVVEDRPAQ